MFKMARLLTAVAVAVSLAACGGIDSPSNEVSENFTGTVDPLGQASNTVLRQQDRRDAADAAVTDAAAGGRFHRARHWPAGRDGLRAGGRLRRAAGCRRSAVRVSPDQQGHVLRARGRRERCPHRFGHLHTATPPPVVGRHVSTLDARIDELYALPLAEFTAARNALAKTVKGDDATRVKRLEKPSLVPWAVNQLYWRERRTYDRLIASGEALRSAQIAALKGRTSDVRGATTAHRAAVCRRRSHGQPACCTGRRAAVGRAAVTDAGSAVACPLTRRRRRAASPNCCSPPDSRHSSESRQQHGHIPRRPSRTAIRQRHRGTPGRAVRSRSRRRKPPRAQMQPPNAAGPQRPKLRPKPPPLPQGRRPKLRYRQRVANWNMRSPRRIVHSRRRTLRASSCAPPRTPSPAPAKRRRGQRPSSRQRKPRCRDSERCVWPRAGLKPPPGSSALNAIQPRPLPGRCLRVC